MVRIDDERWGEGEFVVNSWVFTFSSGMDFLHGE